MTKSMADTMTNTMENFHADNAPPAQPAVSVLVTCYNYGEFLQECIESVLCQTFTDYEIVLVDNASSDNTKDIAANYPQVRYIYEPRLGVGIARNTALRAAKGRFIGFLDADDVWPADRLSFLYPLTVTLHEQKIIPYGKVQNYFYGEEVRKSALAHLMLAKSKGEFHATSLVHQSVYEAIGFFDEEVTYGEDTAFSIRLQKAGFCFQDQDAIVLHRRLHGSNISIVERESSFALHEGREERLKAYRERHKKR